MLRAVLVGLLSMSAVACKSSDEPAKVQPGVAAGKVIEVSGTVTLRRADGARPLAKGDTVEGDDVIETGADGNVIVELSHNLARWELGANRKAKLRESQAWSLPKKVGDVATVEQTSAAAGRHAERSAAETSVSASDNERAPAEPAPAPAAEAAAAPAAAAPAAAAPPLLPSPEREAAKDAVQPKRETRGAAQLGDIGAIGKGGATDAGQGVTTGAGQGVTAGSTRLRAKAAAGPAGDGATLDAATPERAHDVIMKHERTIKACLTKDMPAVSLRIEIAADGKATVTVKGKTEVPDSVRRCVTSAVQKLTFPAQAATVTIEIAR